jgi:hypothetical protein
MNLGNGKSRFESFGEERGPPDLAASGGDQASGNRIEACVWKIQIHSFFKQPGNSRLFMESLAKPREGKTKHPEIPDGHTQS